MSDSNANDPNPCPASRKNLRRECSPSGWEGSLSLQEACIDARNINELVAVKKGEGKVRPAFGARGCQEESRGAQFFGRRRSRIASHKCLGDARVVAFGHRQERTG